MSNEWEDERREFEGKTTDEKLVKIHGRIADLRKQLENVATQQEQRLNAVVASLSALTEEIRKLKERDAK